jgi:hypothetical protein
LVFEKLRGSLAKLAGRRGYAASNLGRRIWIERFGPNLVRTVRSGSDWSDLVGLAGTAGLHGGARWRRRSTAPGDYGLSKLTLENQGGELVLTEPWKREKRRRRGVDGEVRRRSRRGSRRKMM